MRFKGTLALLLVCLGLGAYVYFYEIKGSQQREKAKEAENQVWKFDSQSIRQIELVSRAQRISATRQNEKDWVLGSSFHPRSFDADADELNRLANSASNIRRESIVEPNATNLAQFGLDPAQLELRIKIKDGKESAIRFGNNNPTGNSSYAALAGKKEVLLVSSSVVSAFDKKLDDLRNHQILGFDQPEAQSLSLKSPKGDVQLTKDSNDRWWIAGKETIAADSPGVRGILNALSAGRLKEFFNDPPEEYATLGLDKPIIDVHLTYGKNKAMKHLIIGPEKSSLRRKTRTGPAKEETETGSSGLYLAKDESRPDLFFVEKDLVDKLTKSPNDVRDKALAAIQRWDVDSISLTNTKGSFSFTKSNGEWFAADTKKKAKWELINSILDAMEKPVKEWIDTPAPLSTYGLDKPGIRVVLKQGGTVLADCSFGNSAKDGIYALVKGDSSVKVADPEGLSALDKGEPDLIEPPVAIPGLPVPITVGGPSGSATTVRAPFSTTVTPHSRARLRISRIAR